MARIPAGKDFTGTGQQRGAVKQATGRDFEQRARAWLEQRGLSFIAANVYQAGGEIDLIMRHQQVIVFVEVRYRQNWQFGGAAASVTRSKQQKLLRAANSWLNRFFGSFDTVDCRFDVLAFTANDVEWIQNAFC